MTQANKYRGLAKVEDPSTFMRRVSDIVNSLLQGKMNCTGVFTAASGTTTTTVPDHRVTGDSYIGWSALDANSADTTNFYISSRDPANKQFIITHDNSGNTRNYVYVIIG